MRCILTRQCARMQGLLQTQVPFETPLRVRGPLDGQVFSQEMGGSPGARGMYIACAGSVHGTYG